MYFHLQKWTYFLLKNAKFKGIKSSQVKLRGSFATSEGPLPPPSSPSSSQTGWQWRWLYIVDLVDDDGNLWHGCNKKRSQNLRIAKMHFLTLKQLSGRFMSFFIVNFVEEGRGERGWHIWPHLPLSWPPTELWERRLLQTLSNLWNQTEVRTGQIEFATK